MKPHSLKQLKHNITIGLTAIVLTVFTMISLKPFSSPQLSDRPTTHVNTPERNHLQLNYQAINHSNLSSGTHSNQTPTREFESTVNGLLNSTDPLHKELLFSQLLHSINAKQAETLWGELTRQSTGSQDELRQLRLLGYRWGTLHGEAAMRIAKSEPSSFSHLLATHALEGWASDSPKAALAFMHSSERFQSKSCRLGLLKGLSRSDLKSATRHLLELEQTTDASAYLKPIVESQLNLGFDHAEQWVQDLPSTRLQKRGMLTLSREVLKSGPEVTIQWLSNLSDSSFTPSIAERVSAHFLTSSSPQEHKEVVLDWMEHLPAGATKNMAYEGTMRSWTKHSPTTAAEYLNTLAPSPAKDHAIRVYAIESAQRFPDIAVQWASSISDSELRHNTLIATTRTWMRRDPVAAQAWLRSSNMEEQTMLTILNP